LSYREGRSTLGTIHSAISRRCSKIVLHFSQPGDGRSVSWAWAPFNTRSKPTCNGLLPTPASCSGHTSQQTRCSRTNPFSRSSVSGATVSGAFAPRFSSFTMAQPLAFPFAKGLRRAGSRELAATPHLVDHRDDDQG